MASRQTSDAGFSVAHGLARRIQAGTINQTVGARENHALCGYKQSGLGREGGPKHRAYNRINRLDWPLKTGQFQIVVDDDLALVG